MNRRDLLKAAAGVAAAWGAGRVPVFGKAKAPATQPAVPTPNLLLNKAGVADLQQRIESQPWAKAYWQTLTDQVVAAMAEPIDLPPRGGNWSHNYVCPIHGARLHTGKKIGKWRWEHICPVGPHILLGDPSKATTDFDGNAIMNTHLQNADLLVNAGLHYQVLQDEGCAAWGRQLLAAYAEKYLTYPIHDNRGWPGKGGHVASQPLTEASWLIIMAQGSDLIWETMPAEQKAAAKEKLFYPAVKEILLPSKLLIHNIQCRINSAIGLVGFLFNDPKLVDIAINDPRHGYRQQLAKGVHADGMWIEGSTGYHFFTIDGLWPLAEAARNHQIDLYTDKFHSMFDGPIQLARPDNVLPNFNDSGDSPLSAHAAAYELALGRFDPSNKEYGAIIEASATPTVKKEESEDEGTAPPHARQNRMALIFGVYPLPKGTLPPRKSHNDTSSGYAIMQRGAGADATWLCVKYGPHGGGHGHPDKNHFILYSKKFVLCPDAGTHAYGSPLHLGWDKTTAAHNTLIVDEVSQMPAEGKSIAFGSDGGVDYSITNAGPIYPNLTFIRTAAMIDENLIVFIDQVSANGPHVLDIALHLEGEWKDLPEGKPWTAPRAIGYSYFGNTKTRSTADGAVLTVAHKNRELQQSSVILAGGIATEIITGTGILKTTEDLVPMVLFRRQGKSAAYVWGISLDGSPVALEQLPLDVPPEIATAVRVKRGEKTWTVLTNPRAKPVQFNGERVSRTFSVIA